MTDRNALAAQLREAAGKLINGDVEDGTVEVKMLCDAADALDGQEPFDDSPRARDACDCGAATDGKWADIHTEGCSKMQNRETTGIDDVEWLDAKVIELSKENERLRAVGTWQDISTAPKDGSGILAKLPDKGGPDERAKRDAADYKIGWWLSAALEDPAVCAEMKADINAWFEAQQPGLVVLPRSVAETEKPLTKADGKTISVVYNLISDWYASNKQVSSGEKMYDLATAICDRIAPPATPKDAGR